MFELFWWFNSSDIEGVLVNHPLWCLRLLQHLVGTPIRRAPMGHLFHNRTALPAYISLTKVKRPVIFFLKLSFLLPGAEYFVWWESLHVLHVSLLGYSVMLYQPWLSTYWCVHGQHFLGKRENTGESKYDR